MAKKTAVILVHGIGEQIPMETLRGFIDTVWTTDLSLVSGYRPDPNTGEERTQNASWLKPDERNRSFELQVATTESDSSGRRIDFFEYYWAHRISGTSWEQVRTWLFDILFRNPFRRVPKQLLLAWAFLWFLLILTVAGTLWWSQQNLSAFSEGWWSPLALAIPAALCTLISAKMVSYVGDVVRYVKATPKNIVARQSIRENGVQLLESLMGMNADGTVSESEYDRVIMVGHSLGAIVAYDILSHAFGRHKDHIAATFPNDCKQPNRNAAEALVRDALENPSVEFPIDKYRDLQDAARNELNKIGLPWMVSDFVTLGSPLAHAEFLMAHDRASLEKAKQQRVFPTCPPMLEYDGKTKKRHFTYRAPSLNLPGSDSDPESPRAPHHAALFGYTKWTNIFSPNHLVFWGDIISGPVSAALGLKRKGTDEALCGAKDIAVLPSGDGGPEDRKRRLLTHLDYWKRKVSGEGKEGNIPQHIQHLRDALDL